MAEDQQAHGSQYYLEPMRIEDVPEVSRVERRCFTNPWPESAYRRELRNPANNYYAVLRLRTPDQPDHPPTPEQRGRLALLPLLRRPEPHSPSTDPIVGFTGMWILYDESHVTTIGVAPEHRGRGLGELLLVHLFDEALRRGAEWVTLEVRVSNAPAQALYEKYGFTRQGVRRHYYSDNGEDAYIMWSPSLKDTAYRQQFDELRRRLFQRLTSEGILLDGDRLDDSRH
ncbi:MAG TPA: ribosomal protein S18-alanine N-acetyltransferase [Thermomicrobiaceae bacterium]|nr:ribosomal protein S18-alanine N-acetyltransferase [Thermomicrobiaceae bacterium]